MDRLQRSHLLDHLTGKVFLSQIDAIRGTTETSHGMILDYHLKQCKFLHVRLTKIVAFQPRL